MRQNTSLHGRASIWTGSAEEFTSYRGEKMPGEKKEEVVIRQGQKTPWTAEEEKTLKQLYDAGIPIVDIAKKMGRSPASLNRKVQALFLHRAFKRNCLVCGAGFETRDPKKRFCCRSHFEKFYRTRQQQTEEFFSELDLEKERQEISRFLNGCRRVVCSGDWHIPFISCHAVDCLRQEKGDALIIGGDFLDLYCLSRFRKDKLISLKEEVGMANELLYQVKKNFSSVVLLQANHEKRALKIIQDRLRDVPELLAYFTDLFQQFEDEKVKTTVSWWIRLGKGIVCHPDWFLKIQGKTALESAEYFAGLGENFSFLVNFHTHRTSKLFTKRRLILEAPAMGWRQDYSTQGKYRNPDWHIGYTTLLLDNNGHPVVNKCDNVFLSWGWLDEVDKI